MGDLKKMFDPRTVAFIGPLDEEGGTGRRVLDNLLLSKKQKVFTVNPFTNSMQGDPCYSSIDAVPEKIDLAVITGPKETVPGVVGECGQAGVEGIVILSSGFRASGDEGKRLQEEIIAARKRYGVRIIGPDCAGVIRPSIGLNASLFRAAPASGNIAFISQGGALGRTVLDWAAARRIGFSMVASLGSLLDIEFGDLIDFLGDDHWTRSIIIYMESVGDARKFMSAARGFARNKPIIVVKPGRFTGRATSALSSGLSSEANDMVYDVAFKRAGVVRVDDIGDLFNAAAVLDSRRLPKGPNLAIITNAGGAGLMAMDALIEQRGRPAILSRKSLEELKDLLPPFWNEGNPIDVLEDADIGRYAKVTRICLNDPQVDGVLIIYTPQDAAHPTGLARVIADMAKRAWKPVIAVWLGATFVYEGRDVFNENNIPNYGTPEEAVKTYLYMYRYQRNLELLYETPAELPVDGAPPKNHLKAFIRRAEREGRTVLTEEESKDFLLNYGIPVTVPLMIPGLQWAINKAGTMGYPVVLKVVSPDITCKTDAGGVALGISSPEQLKEAYEGLLQKVKERIPEASIRGITMQKMIEGIDYELILGAKRDEKFGSVILFGMGGIGADFFDDFSIAIPPLNQTLAARLIENTRAYKMLRTFPGKQPADLAELERLIVNFSNLIVDFPEIAGIDINPIAIAKGRPYALDARIVLDKEGPRNPAPYPHLVITPYPTRYISNWTLLDGTDVLLRPIRPEDEPMEHEMLGRLSEETMRVRFFSVIKDITHEMLVRFCNIDYDREMAIVAEIREDGKRRIIGIGRIIIEWDLKSAEFAVLVRDEYQGKGLGYKFVDLLIGIAQDKGLEEIYGEVLTKNEKMLAVCRKLGFTIEEQDDVGPDSITAVRYRLK